LENTNLSEKELLQRDKEHRRKVDINKKLRGMKIKKLGCLMVTALTIAIYFGITSFYLNLVHQYERHYSSEYELIGKRI
jgi:hypothetical protein